MPSWFDRFGEEWATSGLTDDPTNAQANAGWAFIGQAPPTVEQFNSMFQWSDNKDNWLFGQIGNVISSAGMVPDPNDPLQLLKAIQGKLKIKLTANYTIWCDAVNGNDANLGTQNSPFRTIQKAIDWSLESLEPARNWVYIQLQPGTYEPFSMIVPWNGGILVQGDSANQRSYLVKNTNGVCISAKFGGFINVQGLSVEAAGNDTDYNPNGTGMSAFSGGYVSFKDISFGPCSNVHMWAGNGGQVAAVSPISYTIYGGARSHMNASVAGVATNVGCTVTIQNNPAFTVGFVYAVAGGYMQTWNSVYTGTATGKHAWLDSNAVINTGNIAPDTHYPGNSPSSITRGAMYI